MPRPSSGALQRACKANAGSYPQSKKRACRVEKIQPLIPTNHTTMKATFDPNKPRKFTTSHRREMPCIFQQFTVIDLDKPLVPWDKEAKRAHEKITARIYKTKSAAYACLWIPSLPLAFDACGSGRATGCGYHRPSAALAEAIGNAGFTLSESISGAGESAMRQALLAIAECIGIKNPAIIEANH